MAAPMDWSEYRGFPTTPSVRSAIGVAEALIESAPKTQPAATRKNLARLTVALDSLRAAHARRGEGAVKAADRPDTQQIDLRADRAWGAIEMRLRAWTHLAPVLGADHPMVGRAEELLTTLFATGTAFLTLPYHEQQVEMDRLLKLIKSEQLERDLATLAGREFLDAVRDVQPDYVEMVRAMLTRDANNENLLELVRRVMLATELYASSIAGNVDHDDDASVASARRALLPLKNYREAMASPGATGKRREVGAGEGGGSSGGGPNGPPVNPSR